MTDTRITADDHVYTVVDDATTVYMALITGAVVDALSTGPTLTPFRLTTDLLHAYAAVVVERPGGLYSISGYPDRVFPGGGSFNVHLSASAAGYRDSSVVLAVPAGARYPVVAPTIALRPEPVRLQGRVVRPTANGRVPVSGARVRTVDEPNAIATAEHTVALWRPLRFDHAAGTPVQPFGEAAAQQLSLPASAGDTSLAVSGLGGLGAGAFVQIGTIAGEFASVSAVHPGPGMGLPRMDLAAGLAGDHPAGTAVTAVAAAPAAASHLLRDVEAGDGLLILDVAIGALALEIQDPVPARLELAAVGVMTDAAGYYQLDGTAGVSTVWLAAEQGALVTKEPPGVTIPYPAPVTVVDLEVST